MKKALLFSWDDMHGVWIQLNRNVHFFLGIACELAGNVNKLNPINQFASNVTFVFVFNLP